MLNPHSPIPLYRQLADLLSAQIRGQVHAPGERIASEHQLAAEYGLGRPTVRQAIDLLVRKGLLSRRRGSGTYVCEPRQEVDLFSLDGTSASFRKKGVAVQTRLLEPLTLQTVAPEGDNPFGGAPAYHLMRLTLAADGPVLVEAIFLHPGLFPALERFDLNSQSLSAIAEEHFFLRPTGCKQSFSIDFIAEPAARHLEVAPRTPVLLVRRWLDFAQVKQGVYAQLWCRTDRFVFTQTIGGNSDA
ncbi:MAG: GntR family transcriptional regulator [Desulfobacteraceae bacterium]|nr:GntR family transcriptional regulator [Desulfobacteraceae bacterium]